MAIVEIIDNPVNTEKTIERLCNYVVNPKKTGNGLYTGARGLTVHNAYQEIIEMQTLYGNTGGRRGYHITVNFSPNSPLNAYNIWEIAHEISDLFFPEFQVLYGVHTNEEHLHIHLAINTVSLRTGKKLHIDYKTLYWLIKEINDIERRYLNVD